jgi:hypothetical protein
MTTLKSMRRFWWVVALALGLPVTGCASGPTWKEEVVMFDGSKAVVERQQVLGNPLDRELLDITLGAPVKGNILRVPLSAGKWTSRWEAMGLNPQAVGLIAGIWYISATPKLCDDYDKWGRPIPPYVFFKYAGTAWQRITVEDFPAEVSRRNLTYPGSGNHRSAVASGYISAEQAKLLNPGLPDYVNNIYRSGLAGFDRCKRRLEALDANRQSTPATGER